MSQALPSKRDSQAYFRLPYAGLSYSAGPRTRAEQSPYTRQIKSGDAQTKPKASSAIGAKSRAEAGSIDPGTTRKP